LARLFSPNTNFKSSGLSMNTRIVCYSISMVSLVLSGAGIAQTQAPQLTLVTLPLPAGATAVSYKDIDAAGNVLGGVSINSRFEIVEWVGGKTPVVLPRLSADQGVANKNYYPVKLNGAGAVIGLSTSTSAQGIYWDASLHPTAVAQSTELSGLSDAGAMVGSIGDPRLLSDTAAQWANPNSQPALMPYPSALFCSDPIAGECYSWGGPISPNGKYAIEYASQHDNHAPWTSLFVNGTVASNFGNWNLNVSQISNSGVIIGNLDTGVHSTITPWDVQQAYRWEAGTFTEIGALPGAPAGTRFESNARSMNSSGVIVGSSQFASANLISHAVMWINDQIIDLQPVLASQLPAGMIAMDAYALNDSGEFIVVAQNFDTGASAHYVAKPAIPTHTTITSNANPSIYGQQIHLVAKVSPDSGPVPTTGSVQWYDGGVLLGSARLTSIGTSSWETSTWTGDVHNVTAVFPPTGMLGGSTSPVFKQYVHQASTKTVVSASPSPATHGQSVKLTATVVPSSGTIAGQVFFMSGGQILGYSNVDARTKQAWFTTSFATAGSYSITAEFAATSSFLGSTSKAVTLTVK